MRVVLVNEVFVDQVMGGRNPIGRRFRFSSTREPTAESWYDIVGVVPDLGVSDNKVGYGRRIYQTSLPRETGPLRVAIHVTGDPQRFAVRLQELAQATDPALRVLEPKPLPLLEESSGTAFWLELLISLTIVTLMLSLAGVYAVTAFAVTRRTREIGVRVALGAQPLHVLTVVFKRPLVQLALGIGVGAIMALGLANNDLSDVHLDDFGNTAMYALATIVCCAIACVVPTRRALRIQPTEALRDDG